MLHSLMLDYLPIDRCLALMGRLELPQQVTGSVLFVDISGFTSLTEALTKAFGDRRGAEELTLQINRVYDALIKVVNNYQGSVISFAGDAITCWVDGENSAWRAVTCALDIQNTMKQFAAIRMRDDNIVSLAVKVAVTSGDAKRFVVGDPQIQRMDTLVGDTVVRASIAEHLAKSGDIVVDQKTAEQLQDHLPSLEWRKDGETGLRFACVRALESRAPIRPWPAVSMASLSEDMIKPWLLAPIYEKLQSRRGEFLTELRPAVIFFLRFEGIDYENDADAAPRLDAFIRFVQARVSHYDGNVLQLIIGDKGSYLYGAFGAPIAHEDSAWRACSTALSLLDLPADVSYIKPLQIGLSSGTLRTGAYGGANRRTYGILGDEVNLSARLMQAAPPGQIIVSSLVQKKAGSDFKWEGLTPLEVKGKTEKVRAFRLMRLNDPRDLQLEEPHYALPMVGRHSELQEMLAHVDSVMARQGQIIGITGEAGMGKSRLLDAFVQEVWQRSIIGFGGECQAYSVHTPYSVWQPLLRQFFGLKASQTVEEQTAALEQALTRLDASLMLRLPLLGMLLNLPIPHNELTNAMDAKHRKMSLEALIIDCLHLRASAAHADGKSLLLVLEDIHWIDAASQELLELVAQACIDMALLIVVTYRPLDRAETLEKIHQLPHFHLISLVDLDPMSMRFHIEHKMRQLALDALNSSLIQRLIDQAQGNPLYLEELLNYLHDYGLTASASENLALPESLYSLILSRIDRLSETQQITLKVASIMGRMFHLSRLQGYYPMLGNIAQLQADLNRLSDVEITVLDQPEPEIVYLFRHIVTHQVAYESLAHATRTNLHERFAAYLEARQPERILDLIAYHYRNSNNVAKKREYFLKAGQAAAARFANLDAIDYFTQALLIAAPEDIAGRFELHRQRELVYHLQAERREQDTDLNIMGSLAEELDDDRRRAMVALRRAYYTKAVEEFELAAASAQQAVRIAANIGDIETEIQGYIEWGQALWFQDKFEDAKPQLEQALSKSENIPALRAYALRNIGMLAIRQGKLSEARKAYEEALPYFRTSGDKLGESIVMTDLGVIAYFSGDIPRAQQQFVHALQVSRQIGDRWGICSILQNLGAVMADETGDYETACSYLREAWTVARAIGNQQIESHALTDLGCYALAQGDYAAAETYQRNALRVTHITGSRVDQALVLNNMGLIAASRGAYDEAQTLYEQSLAIKQEIGDPVGESETLAGLALLNIQKKDYPAAEQRLETALTLAREAEAGLEEARALRVLGYALLGQARLDEASSAFTASAAQYETLGNQHMALEALTGQANVALQQQAFDRALALVNEMLARLEHRSSDGLENRFQVLLTCYIVLHHHHDDRAHPLLETAHQLLQKQADTIQDMTQRQLFLEGVRAHRDLINALRDG